jgi:hypothetical protein
MTDAATEARWDRERDLRKHDSPSRSTMPPLPLRLTPTISEALQIAILVKGERNFEKCAGLIEQYAQTVAEAAKLDLAIEYERRITVALESPLLDKFEVPNV